MEPKTNLNTSLFAKAVCDDDLRNIFPVKTQFACATLNQMCVSECGILHYSAAENI